LSGECTTSADFSLGSRRLGRFIASTVLASFVLNEIWQMAQMAAYVETAGRSWQSTLALCTRAAASDVAVEDDWGSGSGPAGRRYRQVVQKIIQHPVPPRNELLILKGNRC